LPGSPENMASFGITYTTEVMNGKLLDVNYGVTTQSDIITTVGMRQHGETLPGYSVSNLSARLSDESWSVTFYIDNLFDKYAYVSTRRHVGDIGMGNFYGYDDSVNSIGTNGTGLLRNYGHYLLEPRTIGLKFNYQFEM